MASADCRAEFEGIGENRIGTIALFSSRGGGAVHPTFESEFWAIAGPSDTYYLRAFPVRFEGEARSAVESL